MGILKILDRIYRIHSAAMAQLNIALAPEEPNVYRLRGEPMSGAPSERNVSGNARQAYVSLLWSEEKSFGSRTFYKHYVPTGRGR
jgi:hypothetical protein